MTMGMNVILDTDVKRGLEDEMIKLETVDERTRTEVRTKAFWVQKDAKGKIPKTIGADWRNASVWAATVILHAVKCSKDRSYWF